MRRRLPVAPPVWFALALVALWAGVCHLVGLHELESSPVSVAFLGFLISLVGWIWRGLEVAGRVSLSALAWSVRVLWAFASEVYNGLVDLANVALRGVRRAWRFFRWTYDEVLAPAWRKFWHLVDVVHDTLERVLAPVFQVLRRIRDELLTLYNHWVRPVLDAISITRKALKVLEALHIEWAKKLDAALGRLEEQIDRPFRFLLSKLNEVINLVNRIVTLDGFFQRAILVRSMMRYERDAWAVWWDSLGKRETERTRTAAAASEPRTVDEHAADIKAFLRYGEGENVARAKEHADDMALWFRRHPVGLS